MDRWIPVSALAAVVACCAAGGCSSVLGVVDFSAGGADAGADAGDGSGDRDALDAGDGPAVADAGCTTNMLGCNGAQPQKCIAGTWVPYGGVCGGDTPACLDGACVVCSPRATQCNGNTIQTCSASGAWQDTTDCSDSGMPFCYRASCSVTPASCSAGGPGLTNCGMESENCCTCPLVMGGTYDRTYDPVGADGGVELGPDGSATGEADPATIGSFRLDKYDVTVGRFRQFVNAWNGGTGWLPGAGAGKHSYLNGGKGLMAWEPLSADAGTGYEPGWVTTNDHDVNPTDTNLMGCSSTWTPSQGALENFPMTCVNWYEAYAFCIWDGGFLPSRAEWGYATAAGSQQRQYPWGSTDPGTGNQYAIYGEYYTNCAALGGASWCVAPVGTATLGAGLWGQLDLVGNVNQWNLDDYDYVPMDPCNNCVDLSNQLGNGSRVTQGGNTFSPNMILFFNYLPFAPTGRGPDIGFRCARAP